MPEYHGWTHAPKEQGGTDPIPTALAPIPWIRLKQLGMNQDLTGGNVVILWNDEVNPYPTYFSTQVAFGGTSIIKPLIPGLYSLSCRLAFDTGDVFSGGIQVGINGIDWDLYEEYSNLRPGDNSAPVTKGALWNNNASIYVEATFRAGPTTSVSSATQIYIRTEVPNLTGLGGDETITLWDEGNFVEVRFLGPDPFFPLGLDNSTSEG